MSGFLIDRLVNERGYPLIDETNHDTWVAQPDARLLFFTEDPRHHPESGDMAVVLPELLRIFGDRLSAAVVARWAEKALQRRYGFQRWPALVMVRAGAYVGAIEGMQEWDVFLQTLQRLLASEATRPPGIGIPLVAEGNGGRPARA